MNFIAIWFIVSIDLEFQKYKYLVYGGHFIEKKLNF